jgi:lipopolysaccharide transport system ATP-binding protein
MRTAINVEGLSKIYRLGEIGTGTISRDLERWWKMKVKGKEDPYLKIGETNDRASKGSGDIVYSLKDINFNIDRGQAIGIIGRNGAGKSTLLKILSRVTSPTTGKIEIKGRIASLLEVGTGFHPELTGKENIFLNGAILGMRKAEIKRKLDEIIEFSGVERYVDTPVKRYSSGMYVRLAFAVAAHLESEILIIDEVLAVGDAEFQKKCLGKMGEVSQGEGRTVLFVSHNLASLRLLCKKSMLIEKGHLKNFEDTNTIITEYLNSDVNKNGNKGFQPIDNEIFLLRDVRLENEAKSKVITINDDLLLRIDIFFKVNIGGIAFEFLLYNREEVLVFMSYTTTMKMENGQYYVECRIPKDILSNQKYSITLGVSKDYAYFIEKMESVVEFELENYFDDYGWQGEVPGVIKPKCYWSVNDKPV